MAYLPEQLEMMLAEEKSKVSELERKLAIVTDLEQKYTGYWHDSETLRVAAENRLQQVQFAYYNLVSIHANVNERIHELEEALGYYASPDVYESRITLGGTRQPGVLTERGDFARAALRSRQDPNARANPRHCDHGVDDRECPTCSTSNEGDANG